MIWSKLDNGWTMGETYENGAVDGDKEKDAFQNFEFRRSWIMEEWGELGVIQGMNLRKLKIG
jgi:hypothetical protein